MRRWKEEEIKALVQTNDRVLYNALRKLYACQTADEQTSKRTKYRNGAGFNSCDAEFLSSLARQVIGKGYLSEKQKFYARKKMVKYTKQLTRIANAEVR